VPKAGNLAKNLADNQEIIPQESGENREIRKKIAAETRGKKISRTWWQK